MTVEDLKCDDEAELSLLDVPEMREGGYREATCIAGPKACAVEVPARYRVPSRSV